MNKNCVDIQGMVYGRDPLARGIARITGRSVWRVTLIALVYQSVTMLIPAVLISSFYHGKVPFISVFQHREFAMVGIWAVAMPIIVSAFWAWQPVGVEVLVTKLRNTGVIPMLSDDDALRHFLEHRIGKPLSQPWTMMMALLSMVIAFVLGPIPIWYGAKSNPVWWSINPVYFWGIYSGSQLILWYVLFWALIRQVVVIRALYVLFRHYEIRPKIMHPDGCMGFSAVGNYALLFCIPIILFAFGWAMGLVFMPITTGKEPTLFSTSMCIAAYPVFLSVFIIAPTLAPHRPMKKGREEALETIAAQIRQWLSETDKNEKPSNMDKISALEHRYAMILENYTTWPFRTYVLRTFCMVAVLPLLPTVIPLVFEALKTILVHR